eukprot:PhF_6_TR27307/c0_g1_i1/m.40095/K07916/RAB7L1, RAB7L; Ras-related protein Rab-7L1
MSREVKIIVIGKGRVGKTALVDRYTKKKFDPNYKGTLGVDNTMYTTTIDGEPVTVYIWDIKGQQDKCALRPMYYRGAHAMIVVCNLDPEDYTDSLRGAAEWKADADSKVAQPGDATQPIPAILVGNKLDLGQSMVADPAMQAFVQEHKFKHYFETSAKSGDGVDKAFLGTITEALRIAKIADTLDPSKPKIKHGPTLKSDKTGGQETQKRECGC